MRVVSLLKKKQDILDNNGDDYNDFKQVNRVQLIKADDTPITVYNTADEAVKKVLDLARRVPDPSPEEI